MLTLNTSTIFYTIALLILIYVGYAYFTSSPKQEAFTVDLTQQVVLPQCKGMTPTKLLELFRNDTDYLAKVLVDNNIDTSVVRDFTIYPQLASFLMEKGLLKC